MKRKLQILLCFIGFVGLIRETKAQFTDGFSDGNFTTNPKWIGDDSLFIVNASNELQLADSNYSNNISYLVTESKSISNAVWEFKFRCGFSPTTSNFAEVHLVSDIPNLAGNNNGYYVQIGSETGAADKVTLYKSTNGNRSSIISGRTGTVSSNPEGWIKVTRDSIGNWELLLDTSSAKSGYISEGTALNTDHITSRYFGVHCKYTTTRKFLFFFDSISVTGTFYSDTTKPQVNQLNVLNNSELELQFSEPVEPITALNVANYPANNGIGIPNSATYKGTDSSIVQLTFSTAFTSGTVNQLTIQNIEDRNGNRINITNRNFTYVKIDTAGAGDVQINEIMADPNPPVALPANVDWVEIYNSSSKSFSLKGWTFWDKTTTSRDTLPDELLLSGEYAVLCDKADSAALAPFSGRLILMDGFPALNIDNEIITLRNQLGQLVDQVNYFQSWYRDEDKESGGFTLEKINPNHPCPNSSNWTGSEGLNGGTPGVQNSVYDISPDTDRPRLLSAEIIDANTIKVIFSKKLDSLSIINAVVTGVSLASVAVSEAQAESAVFNLSTPIEEGVVYTLSVKGASDCFGNVITEDEISFGKGRVPLTHHVVINEIFPVPDIEINPLFDAEFVELYNNTGALISLDSCVFSDLSSTAFLSGAIIEPDDYLIICENAAVKNLSKYGKAFGVSSWPSLNNAGDVLTLTCKSEAVHSVSYDDDWYVNEEKNDGGWSLEQIDPNNPCGEQLNWKGSLAENQATPGTDNSVLGVLKDASAPKIIATNAINDTTLKVEFDENISLTDFSTASFNISPSVAVALDSVQGNKVLILKLGSSLISRTIYTLSVKGVSDCVGNTLVEGKATFGLAEPGLFADLVINEVLFDPFSTASTDFVEIYNRSEKIIDLNGWLLADFDENKDTLDGFQEIATEPRAILPGEFVVVNRDNADLLEHYPTRDENTFIEISSFPSYPNDAGSVVLMNDSAQLIDRFDYDANLHHVIIKDPEGVSLERLDYERPTDDETNWHSAAETVGFATPGLENSQFVTSTNFSENVVLEPQTFSPDNDGFDDVLNINYQFDQPGAVANIEIVDTEGRPVYTLTQNEVLATQGTVTWDGATNNGLKARSGMYIVYFEIFDEQGNTERFKKVCVLALKF